MENKKDKKSVFASSEVMSFLENMNGGIQLISEQHTEIIIRLDKLDGRVDRMQGDITEIKHKLSQKVDLEDFQKLENRLIKLERIVLSS
jgi:hypothetical protein